IFPYTTLFRSRAVNDIDSLAVIVQDDRRRNGQDVMRCRPIRINLNVHVLDRDTVLLGELVDHRFKPLARATPGSVKTNELHDPSFELDNRGREQRPAPREGLEPPTNALTGRCSAIELPGNGPRPFRAGGH